MRKIYLMLILSFVILSAGCNKKPSVDINDCSVLASRFDLFIDYNFNPTNCEQYGNVWVGGTLQNITVVYNEAETRYEHALNFAGMNKTGNLYINSQNETIPYKVGTFYRFDLRNKCELLMSAASSGAFSDPYLNNLQALSCS